MIIRQIRNATLYISYGGKEFLLDPMLGAKGSQKPFPNSPRQELRNPLADLPCAASELTHPDYVIITHLHRDHFDRAAAELLDKNLPVFIQNEEEAEKIRSKYGFTCVTALKENCPAKVPCGNGFEGTIRIYRIPAQHSEGKMAEMSGPACGAVFHCPGEKTLYVTGDTVWYPPVEEALRIHKPEVICANAGENLVYGYPPLIMGKEGVRNIADAAPGAVIIASHMESLNHYQLTKADLRAYAEEEGFSDRLRIPEDGERISL